MQQWSPSLCSFEGVLLPHLKVLLLGLFRSDACYGDLLKASLPVLKELVILEDRQLEDVEFDIDFGALSMSPFPSLCSFRFGNLQKDDPQISEEISGAVTVVELMDLPDSELQSSDVNATLATWPRFLWPHLRLLHSRFPALPVCVIEVLLIIAAPDRPLEDEEEESASETD